VNDADSSSTLLGAILVRRAGLSLQVLQQALDQQRTDGGLLGEILIAMGAVSSRDVADALALQRELKSRL
jgi:hypothetical protein